MFNENISLFCKNIDFANKYPYGTCQRMKDKIKLLKNAIFEFSNILNKALSITS